MTKIRPVDSCEYAIAKCLTELRSDVKAVTGKSESYIQMCSDPDNERQLSLRDALLLDIAMQQRGHGTPIADAYQTVLKDEPNGRAGSCPMAAFMQLASTTGMLAEAIREGLADHRLDVHERRAIAAAAQAVIETARAVQDAVDAAPVPIRSAADRRGIAADRRSA